MERSDRFRQIDQLLKQHRAVSMRTLMDRLGVSKATVKRDFDYMRDRMHAPILWDATRQGYHYHYQPGEPVFNLPGLWFNAAEIHALLTMDHLLGSLQPDLQPGLLGGMSHRYASVSAN